MTKQKVSSCTIVSLKETFNSCFENFRASRSMFWGAFFLLFAAPAGAKVTVEEGTAYLKAMASNVDVIKKQVDVLKHYVGAVRSWKSCEQLYEEGHRKDGGYILLIDGDFYQVFCEFMKHNTNKNWLVFQRRTSGRVDFYRNWSDYSQGFGNRSDEFWMGLKGLSHVTTSSPHQLRITLVNFHDEKFYADYSLFEVLDESHNYTIIVGGYSGSAGDSMHYHHEMQFSTYDRDNDKNSRGNCALHNHGAWWYNSCYRANLNGRYFNFNSKNFSGLIWFEWGDIPNSYKFAEMKISPYIT